MDPHYRNSYGLKLSRHCEERTEKGHRRDPLEKSIIEVLEEKMLYGDPYSRFRSEKVSKLDVKEAQMKDMEDMEEKCQAEIDMFLLELEAHNEAGREAAQREKLREKDHERFKTRKRHESEYETISFSPDASILVSPKTSKKENEQPAQSKKPWSKKTETDPEADRKRQMSEMSIRNILDKVVKEGRSEEEKKLQPKPKYQRKRKTSQTIAPQMRGDMRVAQAHAMAGTLKEALARASSSNRIWPQASVVRDTAPPVKGHKGTPSKMLRIE